MSDVLELERASFSRFVLEAERLGRLQELQGSIGTDLPADFKPTRTVEDVLRGISLGRRIHASLVLIAGQNGAGKTTALRWYAARHEDATYWEARAGYQPKHVLADIIRELPVRTGEGWRMQTSIAIEYLAAHPRVFLLDEAQRLNYDSLDLLKYVADNTGSMFVLSASPSLAARIDKWPDIASRCPVRVVVRPLELDEFVELFQADGFSLEVLRQVHRLSRGVLRTIRALMVILDEFIVEFNAAGGKQLRRGDLTPGHVLELARMVVPVPVASEAGGER